MVSLQFDPYAYVRTAVMRSLLYKKADYDKLLKMNFSDIAKFMQESKYHSQINALGIEYQGADLLERALDKNYVEEMSKLRKISHEGLREVIDVYLLRKDIWNLKTILRGKFTGANSADIQKMLLPVGQLREEQLASLLKKDDVAGILSVLPLVDEKTRMQLISAFAQRKDLLEVENGLDRFYYSTLLEFAKSLPGDDMSLTNFFHTEIDVLNIMTILRLKKENADAKKILSLLMGEGKLDKIILHRLASAKTLEDVPRILMTTPYGKIVDTALSDHSHSLVAVETALTHFLLEKSVAVMHRGLLSPNVIIGYLFMKENELRNLRILVRGKQLGVDDNFLEKQLVYAG